MPLSLPRISTHKSISLPILHTPPPHIVLFLINRKRANIFPVFTRLDPHLIKLAHYVALWLVEENQLFNSQTWAAGAGGAQRAAHLIPRTLISYKASSNFPPFFFSTPSFFFPIITHTGHLKQARRGGSITGQAVGGVLRRCFGNREGRGCGGSISASYSRILL